MSAAVASSSASTQAQDPSGWGGNFWVTLADPQTGNEFYACPATGETSWEPPEGHFVLPRTDAGEWWEIDDADTGVPYYYHTVRGETSWQRPEGEFVIPLSMIQNTTMGKRLSAAFLSNRASLIEPDRHKKQDAAQAVERLTPPATPTGDQPPPTTPPPRESVRSASRSTQRTKDSVGRPGSRVAFAEPAVSVSVSPPSPHMRTRSSPASPSANANGTGSSRQRISSNRPPVSGHPIPLSVDVNFGTNGAGRQPFSASASNGHQQSPASTRTGNSNGMPAIHEPAQSSAVQSAEEKAQRMRSKSSTQLRTHIPAHAGGREEGSLLAAAERIARTNGTQTTSLGTPVDSRPRTSFTSLRSTSPPPVPMLPGRRSESAPGPPAQMTDVFYTNSKASASSSSFGNQLTPTPSPARNRTRSGTIGSAGQPHSPLRPVLNGRTISSPVLDHAATKRMAPVVRGGGAVFVERREPKRAYTDSSLDMAGPGHRGFPQELKEDIEQFAGSDFARRYFATHSTGLIFKRKTPIETVMTWQHTPLSSPLLNLTQRTLHRDAIKMFRAVQKVMGDLPSSTSGPYSLREEQRWLLSVCLLHGELRDEAYCQVVKQLRANSNPQSVFQGWQLLCVLLVTFPPSKDFEAYLQSFLERHTGQTEGRVDVMARYCLKRLPIISRKGPRGRTLTVPEIESASDAAFNPSTFGEPLDAIMRLQSRTYPDQKVPIVLPFLADAILALGGTRTEGIFRVPGDGDAVAALKLRIDRGFYTLDGIEDPHVPASLLKLWLRELQTPLVPDEMYNECVSAGASDDAVGSVQLVARLPSHHRRVMVFVVSFLQLFLDDRTTRATKMTAANMALVMAPNLVRCASESVAVVFANAEHEQRFVWNLLLNLQCDVVDPEYRPTHGRGAGARGKQRAG